jgi:hypothetical protein
MTAPVVLGDGQVRLDEVYLAGTTGQGPAVVGGLALLADAQGLTVLGPQPSSVRTMPWGRASTIACRQPAQLPDGRQAVTLEVNIDGNALRFFVPQDYLGPEGAGALEQRLTALSRIPIAPSPPVGIGRDGTVVNGSIASGPGMSSAFQAQGMAQAPAPAQMPPGALPPGALPPATGGTLSVSQGPTAGQYVQAGTKRSGRFMRFGRSRRSRRKARIAAALVVVLVAGGAAAYVVRSHRGSPSSSGAASGDVLAAAEANLAPGDLPGWKGVPGTIAGAIGAFGFRQTSGGASSGTSGAAARDAADFARCDKLSASQADAALAALGFAQGIAAVPGETALSSSPLFEDPSAASTSADSSVIVLGSQSAESAAASTFAERNFAGCYSLFLSAVVPSLVGGATSTLPFAYATVRASSLRPSVAGVSVHGFSETFYRKGRPARGALFGSFDVVSKGRMIAVVQTISSRSFPAAEGTKLLAAVEQNVAGESS